MPAKEAEMQLFFIILALAVIAALGGLAGYFLGSVLIVVLSIIGVACLISLWKSGQSAGSAAIGVALIMLAVAAFLVGMWLTAIGVWAHGASWPHDAWHWLGRHMLR